MPQNKGLQESRNLVLPYFEKLKTEQKKSIKYLTAENLRMNALRRIKLRAEKWVKTMTNVVAGKNDLATWCHQNGRLDLLDEWDYDANLPVSPQNVTHGSNKIANWICSKCGYKWSGRIANRTKAVSPRGCKECGKIRSAISCRQTAILKSGSFNDWCKKNSMEYLLDEWDYDLNWPDTPNNISWGGTKDYWWKCPFCSEPYKARLDHRRRSCGHNQCKLTSFHTSDAEMGVLYYFQKAFGDENIVSKYRSTEISEIDVYIPSLQIGVEYDGEGYHKDVERDQRKDNACHDAGITLYRIREPGCPPLNSSSICVVREKTAFNSDYDKSLIEIFSALDVSIDVNSLRDQGDIIKLRGRQIAENSLASKFPEIAAEWDYEMNAPLTPEMVSYGADRVVGWICSCCSNKYPMLIYSRTGAKKHGCSICAKEARASARRRIVKQYNLAGEYLKSYLSLSDATKETGISQTNISACCSGRYRSSGGFIWRYADDTSAVVPKIEERKPSRYGDSVRQYTLKGEFIAEYCSILDAESKTGVKAANIYRNVVGDRKSASGFMWTSNNNSETISPYRTSSHNRRRVCQFTLSGEYLETFECILDAEKATGICESTIRDCCSGRSKTAGGFIWKDAPQD